MAAVLLAAARRRRRPTARLLGAAAALACLAAALLALSAARMGRVELRISLQGIRAAAALPWVAQQQQQRAWRPPLPAGDPPAGGVADVDDDPFASLGPNYLQPTAAGTASAQPAAVAAKAGAAAPQHAAPGGPDCSEVLGVPKVALLFLATKRLAHEKLWRLWLWDAAHLLPLQARAGVQAAVCGAAPAAGAAWDRIRAHCPLAPRAVTTAGVATELPPQHLFSIYVHAPPDYQGLELQPLTAGRQVAPRYKTAWGDISIMDAEKALLREALKDPLNAKFALISESDVPLYDPLTFYQQLMAEARSRVLACPSGWMNIDRWRDEMATPTLRREHWRKSNQFFGLTRVHAALVVNDTEAYRSFREKCGGWHPQLKRWKECIADEHYIPTLLASQGLEHETYCDGWGLAYTDWRGQAQHPRSFMPKDVGPALVKAARWQCRNMREAVADAPHLFIPLEPILAAETAQQACQLLQASGNVSAPVVDTGSDSSGSDAGSSSSNASSGGGGHNSNPASSGVNYNRGSGSSGGGEAAPSVPGTYRPLDGACPLTARKFPPFTALRLRQLFVSSCPAGGAELAASKAAQVFSVEKDPDVVLLRGRACSPDVQRQVLAHNAAGAGRRLLCAARRWAGGAAAWLPESDCEV